MPLLFYGRVAKDHQPDEKSEDNCAIHVDGKTLIVALSDGAGTVAFSRQWSATLSKWAVQHPIENFTENEVLGWFDNSTEGLYRAWRQRIPPYDELPYYGQNGLIDGSQATLLVVQLENLYLKAFAVGDTCLYHVRDNELMHAFPVTSADDFDTSPALIHTSARVFPNHEGNLNFLETDCLQSDIIFLATDALACWIQKQFEMGEPVWENLSSIHDDKDFCELVRGLRKEKRIRNDDVVLISIRVSGKNELTESKDIFDGSDNHHE